MFAKILLLAGKKIKIKEPTGNHLNSFNRRMFE